jgi:hypothetical protein
MYRGSDPTGFYKRTEALENRLPDLTRLTFDKCAPLEAAPSGDIMKGLNRLMTRLISEQKPSKTGYRI